MLEHDFESVKRVSLVDHGDEPVNFHGSVNSAILIN